MKTEVGMVAYVANDGKKLMVNEHTQTQTVDPEYVGKYDGGKYVDLTYLSLDDAVVIYTTPRSIAFVPDAVELLTINSIIFTEKGEIVVYNDLEESKKYLITDLSKFEKIQNSKKGENPEKYGLSRCIIKCPKGGGLKIELI